MVPDRYRTTIKLKPRTVPIKQKRYPFIWLIASFGRFFIWSILHLVEYSFGLLTHLVDSSFGRVHFWSIVTFDHLYSYSCAFLEIHEF